MVLHIKKNILSNRSTLDNQADVDVIYSITNVCATGKNIYIADATHLKKIAIYAFYHLGTHFCPHIGKNLRKN